MHASLGIERVVLVQPSVYGTDNGCLVEALRLLEGAGRGIAVVDLSLGLDELGELQRAGVCGVRVNLGVAGGVEPAEAIRLLEATENVLRDTSLLIQVYAPLPLLTSCAQTIRSLRRNILLDHFGMPAASAGIEQSGFLELLDLVSSPHVWMKLSGPYQISDLAPGYADVPPIAQALLQAIPDRVVWGSDWPHTGGTHRSAAQRPTDIEPFRREDERHNLALVASSCSRELRQKLLVDNPTRLFRFSQPSAR